MRTAILGAGHNGAVVAYNCNVLKPHPSIEVVGFLDDNKTHEWAQLPILGPLSALHSLRDQHGIEAILVTAIAAPRKRLSIIEQAQQMGYVIPSLAPPLPPWVKVGEGSYVDKDAVLHGCNINIGDYAIIGPLAYVEGDTHIGRAAMVSAQCFVGYGSKLGECAHLYQRAMIKPKCIIGDDCVIHPGAQLSMGMTLETGQEYPRIKREHRF